MVASFEKTTKKSPFAGRAVNIKTHIAEVATSSLDDIYGEVEEGISYKAGAEIPAPKQPVTAIETASWLINSLGISPVPNCPAKAVEFGKASRAKSPMFVNWSGKVQPVNWQDWQDCIPPKELRKDWWEGKNAIHNGVGAIANSKRNSKRHFIRMADTDAKDYAEGDYELEVLAEGEAIKKGQKDIEDCKFTQEERDQLYATLAKRCEEDVKQWEEKYPILKLAPCYRSPNGGYRHFLALENEDPLFKNVSTFNHEPGQDKKHGEIVQHSLLPPSKLADGKGYEWVRWFEYPPVVENYESIGLFPTLKASDKKQPATPKIVVDPQVKNDDQTVETKGDDKFNQLIADTNNTLPLEQAFNWPGHNFIETTGKHGRKLQGNCPWHESSSGTAFYCERDGKGNLVYRCPACNAGGNVFGYRHSLKGGQIGLQPKGKEFIGVLRELAGEAGLDCSFLDKPKKSTKKVQKVSYNNEQSDPLVSALQIAENTLFNKDKIVRCFEDNFYQWEGNYYKLIPMKTIRKLVGNYWNNVSVEDEEGNIRFPFCDPRHTTKLINWVIDRKSIDYSELPQGINFTNGVVKLDWTNNIPTPVLEKHDPDKHYFFSEPKVNYDPVANSNDCDKMLTSLDPNQRIILLKVLAASLDLQEVRTRIGARKIKTLFLIGEGSNGKDTFREAMTHIIGDNSITAASLNHFIDYDNGRQFNLASLIKSKINWPSESLAKTTNIDKSPSLKMFATGEPMYSERKGIDPEKYKPKGICLFNLNELPNLYGTSQAAMDRFAPIHFRKTFVTGSNFDPTNPNHVIADNRFKDDPNFITSKICPALFNYLIKALQDLITNGIDYSCTTELLEQIQQENDHLFEFIDSIGLKTGNGEVKLDDIFSKLENHYKDLGILVIDEFKNRRWSDPVKPSDPYIKGANNVYPRLKKLFPKIDKYTFTDPTTKRKTTFIKGLQLISESDRIKLPQPIPEPRQQQLLIAPLSRFDPLKGVTGKPTTNPLETHYENLEPLPDKESKPSKPSKPTFSNFQKKIEISLLDPNPEPVNTPHNPKCPESTAIGGESGFTGFTGSESVDIQAFEETAKNQTGFTVGLPDAKVGLPESENSTNKLGITKVVPPASTTTNQKSDCTPAPDIKIACGDKLVQVMEEEIPDSSLRTVKSLITGKEAQISKYYLTAPTEVAIKAVAAKLDNKGLEVLESVIKMFLPQFVGIITTTSDTTPPDWISKIVVDDVDTVAEQKRREREQEQREYDQELESLKVKVLAATTVQEHEQLLNVALSFDNRLTYPIRTFLGQLGDVSLDILKVWEWSYW
ncbi:DUF5906 domain-containing protein [Anabaena catenula]|uniref:SF3 helicase domain-containing protein n=1 Tax=Anabaena catenula FACHB-362 TaxID=2692877 RepID=A0ABR8J8Z3_9NOST|nr:DUF5906 domain-containing protein [Anabaena catenula]MBD2694839.1 hypothetical protein [Anabaena catenula FACHB-362]